MTGPAADPPVEESPSVPDAVPDARASAPLAAERSIDERLRAVCPYLLGEDGASRRLAAWRGHRCMALRPPGRLALDKQQRLCLASGHVTCPAYLAARGSDLLSASAGVTADLERVTRWSFTRTATSVVEPGSRLDGITSRLSGTFAQAVLGGALLVALLAMARGQFLPAAAPTATPTGAASPTGTATQLATPPPTATPSATVVAEVTPPPTPAPPTPTPRPTGSQVYVVRSGDTLWDIAIAFGTTVKALQELNGIGPNDVLHVGQRIQIP
jgi:LysM repeat protein